jgi:hypothetical protein
MIVHHQATTPKLIGPVRLAFCSQFRTFAANEDAHPQEVENLLSEKDRAFIRTEVTEPWLKGVF